MTRHRARVHVLAACAVAVLFAAPGKGRAESPARMVVSGYGLLGNSQLTKTLRLLQPGARGPVTYDANAVEDAAMVLLSQLVRDGYLKPTLTVAATQVDGSVVTRTWDETLEPLLPRPLAATQVEFRLHPGVLYFYGRIDFDGLRTLPADRAKELFVRSDFLVRVASTRVYTPARFDRSMASLRSQIESLGLEHADVQVGTLSRDDQTGRVDVKIVVREGARVRVRSVTVQVFGPGDTVPQGLEIRRPDQPYSRYWLQDFSQQLKNEQYRKGFPDVAVEVTEVARELHEEAEDLDLLAKVRTGPHVTVGQVRVQGNRRTGQSVLRSRIRLEPGEDLNPIRIDKSRQRLSRLGVFDEVDVNYAEVDATTRDVIFTVQEGKRMDLSLLFGYGSYEQVQGGFELEQFSLWGRAHNARLRAVQSLKSTRVDYLYSMPELIGEELNVFFDASALRRQEVSFVREEQNTALGVQRYLPPIHMDMNLRYNYQFLNAGDVRTLTPPLERARAAALVLDLTHDRRDHPLVPNKGYKVWVNWEMASTSLGGDVDYDRIDLSASWHIRLGGGRLLHLGVSHGGVFTLSGTRDNLPFNKRFFPGGENSVRGFQNGQASPRDSYGNIVGAESYTLGNIELEQRITPSWSVVGFVDGVGTAASISDYPWTEGLFSAGAGVRFNTIVGPVRLEYGHVLNPRPYDPSGTLHLTIGFPF